MPTLPDENDLTDFEKLKTLLAPYEANLKLPDGVALADVPPEVDPASELPADLQRVMKLGFHKQDLRDVFGVDFKPEPFLRGMRSFWVDESVGGSDLFCDADPAGVEALDGFLRSHGSDTSGGEYAVVILGERRGEVCHLDHESIGDEAFDGVPLDGTPEEILEACNHFLWPSGINTERCFVQLLENVHHQGAFDEAAIAELLETSSELDLSNQKLDAFPTAVLAFPQITSLDLSDNLIPEIPAGIARLENLEVLRASDNRLASVDPAIGRLQKLRVLDLHDNYVTELQPAIFDCLALEELDLRSVAQAPGVEKIVVPPAIQGLKRLKVLRTFTVRYEIDGFPNLREVTGDPIDLRPVRAAIAAVAQLDDKALAYVMEHGTPADVEEALRTRYDGERKVLDLDTLQVDTLPGELANIDVEVLHARSVLRPDLLDRRPLRGRRVTGDGAIAAAKADSLRRVGVLAEMTGLRELHLTSNALHALPDLSALTELRVLELGDNEIDSLDGLRLPSLRVLNLPQNRLTAFRADDAFAELQSLDLRHNRLASAPDVSGCPKLRKIDASGLAVPEGVGGLPEGLPPGIRVLTFDIGHYTEFPEEVFAFTQLEHLGLDGCLELNRIKLSKATVARFSELKNLACLQHDLFKPDSARDRWMEEALPEDCAMAFG